MRLSLKIIRANSPATVYFELSGWMESTIMACETNCFCEHGPKTFSRTIPLHQAFPFALLNNIYFSCTFLACFPHKILEASDTTKTPGSVSGDFPTIINGPSDFNLTTCHFKLLLSAWRLHQKATEQKIPSKKWIQQKEANKAFSLLKCGWLSPISVFFNPILWRLLERNTLCLYWQMQLQPQNQRRRKGCQAGTWSLCFQTPDKL